MSDIIIKIYLKIEMGVWMRFFCLIVRTSIRLLLTR